MNLFITNLWRDPAFFFMISLIVIFSICLHEYFHAQCASWLGDSTAAERGHLTLNPLRQMGMMSLIMFLFIGFAWGAVPVNQERLRARHSWGELAVAAAGPSANLLLTIIAWLTFGLLAGNPALLPASEFAAMNILNIFFYLGIYNIVLFLFNLIPAPGLDGWNIFCFFVPATRTVQSETVKGFMVFLIFVAVLGVRYLLYAAVWIMRWAPALLSLSTEA